jgi:tape measure domain-containing protein
MIGLNVGSVYYDVSLDTAQMIDGSRKVEQETKKVAGSFNAITLAVKALAAAYAALKFADIADEWGQFDSRMRMATRSAEEHAHAQRRMRESANETFRAINETREAFIRMSPVLRDMGLTLDQSIDAIDAFSGLLVTNAASADRGRSAMDALSKAMQKGSIDADAWATISATMPNIVELIAKTTGMATDEIRRLGTEGKLSVTDLTRTLVQGKDEIMQSVREMPTTFRDALQNLNNGLVEYIGQVNRASKFSATLTDVVVGAGDIMGQLAVQISEANDEADKLGGNTSVFSWADATRTVLSYVVDAADFVTRGFRQMGMGLGGLAAAATMTANGEFRQAADTLKATWADVVAIGSAPLSGARMRQAFAAGDVSAPGTQAEPLNIKGGRGDKTKKKRASGETEAEIKARQDLARIARVDAAEREAEENAQREAEIRARQDLDRIARVDAAEEEADRRAQERERMRAQAADFIAQNDPIARLQLELERKSALLAEYAAQDQESAELYASARVALEAETAKRVTGILQQEQFDRLAAQSQLLGATSSLFGELAGLAKNFGGEQSSTFKALFAASKGFAIADAGLKLNMAILQAMADPTALSPQQKLANYAAIAAAGGSLISAISSASYGGGRQYGGPVSAGSMYRVNETGAPEMFVGSGGRQYMMPTTRGEVVPADQVGGAGGWTIIVNEAPAGMRATVDAEQRIVRFAVDQSKAEIAGEIASNTGGVWRALSSASTVRPKL